MYHTEKQHRSPVSSFVKCTLIVKKETIALRRQDPGDQTFALVHSCVPFRYQLGTLYTKSAAVQTQYNLSRFVCRRFFFQNWRYYENKHSISPACYWSHYFQSMNCTDILLYCKWHATQIDICIKDKTLKVQDCSFLKALKVIRKIKGHSSNMLLAI